jgi:RNA exonuclease 4
VKLRRGFENFSFPRKQNLYQPNAKLIESKDVLIALSGSSQGIMDTQSLSSNWKNLQGKIKQDKSKPLKRKASSEDHDRHWESRVKRHRSEKIPGTKKSLQEQNGDRMDSSTSQEPAPSASLALWAEDNDISSAVLEQAYGFSTRSMSVPGRSKDRVNEGLSKT